MRSRGFTLIELMVTLAVLAILVTIAIPSFVEFRERTAVRGAGEQMVSFWANARLEALKRDQQVSVSIRKSAGNTCMGASTVLTGCNCFTAGACDVGQYPTAQGEWSGATVVGQPDLGPTDNDDNGLAVIDPKRGYLTNATDLGGVTMQSPGAKNYRIKLFVDRWARPFLCVPTNSPRTLPDYTTRTCAP